jgi:hypothetical protein
MTRSRRDFLGLAAGAPMAMFFAGAARAADAPVCYDPATLPFSQKSQRRSLGYVEVSADPNKHCGACAFFTASAQGGCGTCQLLGGAAVRGDAVCSSFAPKAHA